MVDSSDTDDWTDEDVDAYVTDLIARAKAGEREAIIEFMDAVFATGPYSDGDGDKRD